MASVSNCWATGGQCRACRAATARHGATGQSLASLRTNKRDVMPGLRQPRHLLGVRSSGRTVSAASSGARITLRRARTAPDRYVHVGLDAGVSPPASRGAKRSPAARWSWPPSATGTLASARSSSASYAARNERRKQLFPEAIARKGARLRTRLRRSGGPPRPANAASCTAPRRHRRPAPLSDADAPRPCARSTARHRIRTAAHPDRAPLTYPALKRRVLGDRRRRQRPQVYPLLGQPHRRRPVPRPIDDRPQEGEIRRLIDEVVAPAPDGVRPLDNPDATASPAPNDELPPATEACVHRRTVSRQRLISATYVQPL